ncbi:hypothetical protein ACE6H2_023753 [Prunus campanulata]
MEQLPFHSQASINPYCCFYCSHEGGHGCFADGKLPITPSEPALPMRRLAGPRCLDRSFGVVPYGRCLSARDVVAWLFI